jgi:hypothetical protein
MSGFLDWMTNFHIQQQYRSLVKEFLTSQQDGDVRDFSYDLPMQTVITLCNDRKRVSELRTEKLGSKPNDEIVGAHEGVSSIRSKPWYQKVPE